MLRYNQVKGKQLKQLLKEENKHDEGKKICFKKWFGI